MNMTNATVLRVIVPDLEPYISYNGTSLFGPYGVLLTAFAVWANLTLKIDYQQCKTSSNYAKCRLVGPDGYPTVGKNHDLNMYPAAVGSYNEDLAITPTRNSVGWILPPIREYPTCRYSAGVWGGTCRNSRTAGKRDIQYLIDMARKC
ncbi:hypothetical protein quinque_000935 [Culex quinquefasciatus]